MSEALFDLYNVFQIQLQIPLDLSTLTDAEKRQRLEARKPKKVVKIEEDLEDSYSAKRYLRFVMK